MYVPDFFFFIWSSDWENKNRQPVVLFSAYFYFFYSGKRLNLRNPFLECFCHYKCFYRISSAYAWVISRPTKKQNIYNTATTRTQNVSYNKDTLKALKPRTQKTHLMSKLLTPPPVQRLLAAIPAVRRVSLPPVEQKKSWHCQFQPYILRAYADENKVEPSAPSVAAWPAK